MKNIIFLSVLILTCTFSQSQTKSPSFKLNFTSIDKFLTQKFTPSQVQLAIKPYSLVNKKATEWKFRDESKSWAGEADLYVQIDPETKQIKEIAFLAPGTRAIEYSDEIKDKLGFTFVLTDNSGEAYGEKPIDVYENKTKKLGVKIVSADFVGQGMMYYRMYRL